MGGAVRRYSQRGGFALLPGLSEERVPDHSSSALRLVLPRDAWARVRDLDAVAVVVVS